MGKSTYSHVEFTLHVVKSTSSTPMGAHSACGEVRFIYFHVELSLLKHVTILPRIEPPGFCTPKSSTIDFCCKWSSDNKIVHLLDSVFRIHVVQ